MLDADGEQHERVFDAAWADDREPDIDGRVGSVGSTVDVSRTSYDNTIGTWYTPAQ